MNERMSKHSGAHKRSKQGKASERLIGANEQMRKWTSQQPSTSVWIIGYSGPQCVFLHLHLSIHVSVHQSWKKTTNITVVQISQESECKYLATHLSVHSLNCLLRTAHSAHLLTQSQAREKMDDWMSQIDRVLSHSARGAQRMQLLLRHLSKNYLSY